MLERFGIGGLLLVSAVIAVVSLGCGAFTGRIVETAAQRQIDLVRTELLEADGLSVFLCGTGSPLPDSESAAACTLIIAGGRLYVVDVGPGSQEVAQLAGMPVGALEAVFLTHFHSDHIGELGEWAVQSWLAGRSQGFEVYGPEGVERVVDGYSRAYEMDAGYRIAHHGEDNLPPAAVLWRGHPVAASQGQGATIFERDGLVVTAFAVDHEPVAPAVGYRFDYRGRSVVISGDTAQSSNLEWNARGADLLVHEVLLKDVIQQVSEVLGEAGETRRQRLAVDVLDYHASPQEAAETARAAEVDTLVFTHIVPAVPRALRRSLFLRDVDAGEVDVILGEDAMLFRLPADSDKIELE